MDCTKLLSGLCGFCLLLQSAPVLAAFSAESNVFVVQSDTGFDAFSVRLPENSTSFRYEYFVKNTWSSWQEYDSDGDALAGDESELLMLPLGTTKIRVEGVASAEAIHPISISHDPVSYRTASIKNSGSPSVLSRRDWGADESFTFSQSVPTDAVASDTTKSDNGVSATTAVDTRMKDCLSAQNNYPAEFKVASTVKTDANGKRYAWPLQYSKEIKLLVVHHSALIVQGDPRPAAERVRALYKYHALNKGWGDIGYNFVVDETGQVYEGRQGGENVVAGHAYCNNVGTIGIVMMGNFELEMPSQAQAKGLQRLLDSLAKEYGIDVHRSVQFHGKTFDTPIVGHRDLLSTLCPGFSLLSGLPQIIANVQAGNVDGSVKFTAPKTASSSSSSASVKTSALGLAEGVAYIGRTGISINPGGKQRLSFTYTAGNSGAYEGKKIGEVRLSTPLIKLWLDDGVHQIPITKGVLLGTDLPAGETASVQLIVQAPQDAGTYSMDIAGLHFTLSVYGRRARTGEYINPFASTKIIPHASEPKPVVTSVPRIPRPSRKTSSSLAPRSPLHADEVGSIRIRLSSTASPTVTFTDVGTINGQSISRGTAVNLFIRGNMCVANVGGSPLASDAVLRLQSRDAGTLTIDAVRGKIGAYAGVIECRVSDGALVLINELPLETYMAGLAEEPDTEPYEKQRAFAIAARTYAAYYMDSANRKFAGKPYDGSDDPAVFQSYFGVNFAGNNPRWVDAVTSTAGQVLKIGSALIKPPYFSSNDGRTRSPAEAGWKNFPFAEVFMSKKDPWCTGLTLRGHGVGMSGCGALGQAKEGRSGEQILQYYYPGTRIMQL